MTHDIANLVRLGREHKKHRTAIEQLRPQLAPEIVAADAAGVPQKDIAEMSGYTREIVRQLCLTGEQREAEKERRRQRTRKKD